MNRIIVKPRLPARRRVGAVLFAAGLVWCDVGFASDHGAAADPIYAHEPLGNAASASNTSGIELGEFRIRSYYPVQAQKSIVRFVLYATAPPDRFADAQRVVNQRRHKVRDQVITATRMVPLAEFDEPDLTRFRRRIILRLRRTMPELPLDDIFVSNFELQVQSL